MIIHIPNLGYIAEPNGCYWSDPHEVIAPKHGFEKCYLFPANRFLDGKNDIEGLLNELRNEERYPKNAEVIIDLEVDGRYPWTIDGQPNKRAVDWLITFIRTCKLYREDIRFGLWDLIPGIWKSDYEYQFNRLNESLVQLADEVDAIYSAFYERKAGFNLSQRLKVQEMKLQSCQRYFPGKTIRPFYWPQWLDVRLKLGKKDRYTEAEQKSGNYQAGVLSAMLDRAMLCGVTDAVCYGEYAWPFNGAWVNELLSTK